MEIGILSMQRIANHGSIWQAYLLKKMLVDRGHNVDFIDIVKGRKLYHYPRSTFNLKKLKYYLSFRMQRKKIFDSVIKNMLGCSSLPNYSSDYDCIIIGSDEVFNFAQPAAWGFSPQLHGAIDNDHVSSYAASFGASTYNDIEKYGVHDELVAAMSNLKHISVRDENSYNIAKQLLPNAEVYRHLDPVLIGDLPVPERQDVKQKYIVVYSYSFRFDDKEYIRKIKDFAKNNGYKIYSVGCYQTWTDKNINADPFELLQYFVNAEYVITDTFHGTIFSVRCHKKFVTVIRKGRRGNEQKLSTLLKDLGLNDRLLTDKETFEKKLTANINYILVDDILTKERNRTFEYLDMILNQ